MITGTVNSQLEILINAIVRDSAGTDHEIQTLLDTGFTGSLTLPAAMISALGLRWRMRDMATLANGEVEQLDVYSAKVIWGGMERRIQVQAIEADPLLGMEMLCGFDLRTRVEAGGHVELTIIP
jgi:clan AA aspartic protease